MPAKDSGEFLSRVGLVNRLLEWLHLHVTNCRASAAADPRPVAAEEQKMLPPPDTASRWSWTNTRTSWRSIWGAGGAYCPRQRREPGKSRHGGSRGASYAPNIDERHRSDRERLSR